MQIKKAQLKALADARSWDRGVRYFEEGRVDDLVEDRDGLVGYVLGQRRYEVELRVEDGDLGGTCSCPMGDEGVFCKHCVAVGLAYLDGGGGLSEPARPTSPTRAARRRRHRVTRLEEVRAYLSRQDPATLVEIIAEQAAHDQALRRRLLLQTATDRARGPDIDAFTAAIDRATDTGGYVDYYAARGFAAGIHEVVHSIADLLGAGHAAAAIALTEHALKRVEEALHEADDSDGVLGGILDHLQEMHHRACVGARPAPEALARRLFQWEMASDWEVFLGAAETYADVLGEKGLAIYRALAEAQWSKVRPLGPGQERQAYDQNRFRITTIMESLARADGDLDALIEVKRRDLSSAYAYLEIAQVCKSARKPNEALRWAEEGLKAFPQGTDPRLREFLAGEYRRRRRHHDALHLIWANFEDRPGLDSYRTLKQYAERVDAWSTWRERALESLRAAERKRSGGKGLTSNDWMTGLAHSTVVEILRWERDVEAAWQEAQAAGCSSHQWLELARIREKDHPADALAVYRERIEPLVECTNNDAYREAVNLIRKVGTLMRRLGRAEEFTEYLRALRTTYKRKRNFIKMLARVRD